MYPSATITATMCSPCRGEACLATLAILIALGIFDPLRAANDIGAVR